MRLDDPSLSAELKEMKRRIAALEKATPAGLTSISEDALEITGEAALIVNGGGSARVDGSLIITGLLQADGTITFTGQFDVSGETHITGPTEITGTTQITGATSITGDTTLSGDLTVQDGGAITVAGSPSAKLGVTSGGRAGLDFGAGELSALADRIALSAGSATAGVSTTFAAIAFGSNVVLVTSGGIYLQGLGTTSSPANLYADSSGHLARSTATPGGGTV
jgi:hypothetical protein